MTTAHQAKNAVPLQVKELNTLCIGVCTCSIQVTYSRKFVSKKFAHSQLFLLQVDFGTLDLGDFIFTRS